MRFLSHLAFAASALLAFPCNVHAQQHYTCDSPLYCPGKILDTVQRAALYNDSKTFVDKPSTQPLEAVVAAFNALPVNVSNAQLQAWVDANFGPEGSEIEAITPRDWTSTPAFLSSISDTVLRDFASTVHGYWQILTRDFKKNTTQCAGCVSSLLQANHTFVVPGGRFRELYYWDSYFILLGLAKSEMYSTMADVIQNFMDFVQKYGFMPNGSRLYYLDRSQPPMLTQMVSLYLNTTGNTTMLSEWLPILDTEYSFWQQNRTIAVTKAGTTFNLSHYDVTNSAPRPESYLEDVVTVEGANLTTAGQTNLYHNLATGAETGWDFSSRWIEKPVNDSSSADQETNLRQLVTSSIVPVDLNSIMFANELTLQSLHMKSGDAAKAQSYGRAADTRRLAVWNVLYDDSLGEFRDWDMVASAPNEWTSASFWPVWAGIADSDPRNSTATQADRCTTMASSFKVLDDLLKFPGGIPTTLERTGLQWDGPNSWPPQTWIAINALTRTASQCPSIPNLQAHASSITTTFVQQAFCSWRNSGGSLPGVPAIASAPADGGIMFEKFSSDSVGVPGGGGEYTVQAGFGWTNGVTLAILASAFGENLVVPDCNGTTTSASTNSTGTGAAASSAAGRRVAPLWTVMVACLYPLLAFL